jgi:hypothetical protein
LTLFQTPTLALHAATKGYVDTEITAAPFLNETGDAMTAGFLTLFQDPTLALHAATKQYTDAGLRPATSGPGAVTTDGTPQYHFSTSAPLVGDGGDGDVWFQYV